MKTAIELITQERKEQIEKHGFTIQHDTDVYDEEVTGNYAEPSDLVKAAFACISADADQFPHSWEDSPFVDKIRLKNYKERLVIAAALLAAEIDRHIEKYQD